MKNEPLGLPKGSVRAILALVLVGAAVALAFTTNQEKTVASLLSMSSFAVGYYFAKRDNNNGEQK